MIRVGVVSRSFPEMTNEQTADFMKENGFPTTELCLSATDSKYWTYNGTSDLSDLTDERFASICEIYRSRGIELSALGVFTNLIEPDEEKRADIAKGGLVLTGRGVLPGLDQFLADVMGLRTRVALNADTAAAEGAAKALAKLQ